MSNLNGKESNFKKRNEKKLTEHPVRPRNS
jgi:hypothetical protein